MHTVNEEQKASISTDYDADLLHDLFRGLFRAEMESDATDMTQYMTGGMWKEPQQIH